MDMAYDGKLDGCNNTRQIQTKYERLARQVAQAAKSRSTWEEITQDL